MLCFYKLINNYLGLVVDAIIVKINELLNLDRGNTIFKYTKNNQPLTFNIWGGPV
jgi:hypothetical protein